ncbi:MAG: F0F1 ATP synthase subunit A [Candidatus Walczuchella monophlebidarum]
MTNSIFLSPYKQSYWYAPNVTGNINTTLVLSLITFLIRTWKHLPRITIFVRFLRIPIELVGIFIRLMTLCIRLFANITAGHLIILSLICVIFIFKSIFAAGFVIPFASAGVWCLLYKHSYFQRSLPYLLEWL